jgi:hypothetical protein
MPPQGEGGIGPYGDRHYPDVPPRVYGQNITFFNQYDVTTSSNISFRFGVFVVDLVIVA